MSDREIYMQEALRLAEEAAACGDVPVGCVITDADGSIIGRGRNRREENRDATAHAEVEAIREACIARGSWHHQRAYPRAGFRRAGREQRLLRQRH